MTSDSLPPSVTANALERYAITAADGDAEGWSKLMAALEPTVRWLATRRAGRHLSAAGHNDLFVRVVDRLRTDNRRGLLEYIRARGQYPRLDFVTYLGAIVASALADYIHRRPDSERPRHNAARELDHRVAAVGELDDIGAELAVIVDPNFPLEQRRALMLWLHGNDLPEIAAELRLASPDHARVLLEGARERLRFVIPRAESHSEFELDPENDPDIEITGDHQ